MPGYALTKAFQGAYALFGGLRIVPTIGLVALAGGGKPGATQLSPGVNHILTCATTNDSVLLPPAIAGMMVMVFNNGAAAARVFGAGTDTIDAVATATGVPLGIAKRCWYIATADGLWVSAQMGVISA